ncbi:4'-phosphopantetheinyl transferase family protein [Kribbella sp. NPDC050470]|uniref:4'-phosphopantetheinyl transferase family protein n=1 Tax=unclassified Kribbella TaxID=2644121 RepID=UPI0037B6CC35
MGDSVHVWLAPAGDPSAAHTLLLDLAASLLGGTPSLHHTPTGQPHIDGLSVSLSRTPTLTAAAASFAAPVGIDIEDLHPREVGGLARRWFDPLELQWLTGQADQLTAFLHLWTAKEAVGKALGLGLHNTGLRRRMPLPPTNDPPLRAGLVPSAPTLAVLHPPVDKQTILALAAPATTAELAVTTHHQAVPHRTVASQTSLRVVTQGN